LKEFSIKLNKNNKQNIDKLVNEIKSSPTKQLQTSININNQNINIPTDKMVKDNYNGDNNELNVTLKEVSNLLEKCWKNELNKQQKARVDQQEEIETLKEILSVYQNLSKLIQLQSNTLKTTLVDFENLCIDNSQKQQNILQENVASMTNSEFSSPDKTKVSLTQIPNGEEFKYYPISNSTQIQLLSSADMIPKTHHQNEEYVAIKSSNSSRKKRRKTWNKKSAKNTSRKTPAFSFEYNRQTVSSHNKKLKTKKKRKTKKTT